MFYHPNDKSFGPRILRASCASLPLDPKGACREIEDLGKVETKLEILLQIATGKSGKFLKEKQKSRTWGNFIFKHPDPQLRTKSETHGNFLSTFYHIYINSAGPQVVVAL